ncbi:MAG: lactonase family protein [Kiritimatiellae bacterium]|nr:lactonase family protein [Kiritimatiellia bacterium]
MKYTTFVGSLTDAEHPAGIYILESDADTGDFRLVRTVDAGANPSYMALTRDCTRLYTVTGRPGFGGKGHNGGLAAYRVDGDNLTPINCVPTGHTVPCYLALSPDERTLVWAEYSHATAGFADLAEDGSISARRQMVQHVGDGPNKPRQDKAHAHCSEVTPDSRYQLVVDLGIDQIKAYDFVNRSDGMKECPKVTINTFPPGAGPRHVVFQKNGRIMYVIFELYNLVAGYRYTGESFEYVETRALIADPALNRDCKASAVKLSEDGTQLFCSNRDCSMRARDTITVFNTDPDTGRMEFLAETPVGGSFPRDFEFMPGGKFLLVGLKRNDQIASFAYDRATGRFDLVKKMDGFHRTLYFRFKTQGAKA